MDQAGRQDAERVRRTLAGDRRAFEELVTCHHRPLYRLLRGICRNREDTEDATQEAFLRAYRALDRFDLSRPFRPWLWTIGIRIALNLIARKDRRNLSLDGPDRIDDSDESAAPERWMVDQGAIEQIEGGLLKREFLEALDEMDADSRAVLLLRVIEEKSYEEIAEVLEAPIGTVMSRLSRSREKLRARLRDWIPEGKSDERSM